MSVVSISKTEAVIDQVWSELNHEAREYTAKELALTSVLYASILDQKTFCRALAHHLAEKLATPDLAALMLRKTFMEIFSEQSGDAASIVESAAKDLVAVRERDPACNSYLQCFLYFKGFLASTNPPCRARFMEAKQALACLSSSKPLFGIVWC